MNAQLKSYPRTTNQQSNERRERNGWHSAPRIREFGTGYGNSDGYARERSYTRSSYAAGFKYL